MTFSCRTTSRFDDDGTIWLRDYGYDDDDETVDDDETQAKTNSNVRAAWPRQAWDSSQWASRLQTLVVVMEDVSTSSSLLPNYEPANRWASEHVAIVIAITIIFFGKSAVVYCCVVPSTPPLPHRLDRIVAKISWSIQVSVIESHQSIDRLNSTTTSTSGIIIDMNGSLMFHKQRRNDNETLTILKCSGSWCYCMNTELQSLTHVIHSNVSFHEWIQEDPTEQAIHTVQPN